MVSHLYMGSAKCAGAYFQARGVAANMSFLYFIKNVLIYSVFVGTVSHGKLIKFFKGIQSNLMVVALTLTVYRYHF